MPASRWCREKVEQLPWWRRLTRSLVAVGQLLLVWWWATLPGAGVSVLTGSFLLGVLVAAQLIVISMLLPDLEVKVPGGSSGPGRVSAFARRYGSGRGSGAVALDRCSCRHHRSHLRVLASPEAGGL